MKSLAELREFFSHDRYATATTGIEILEAQDGYAKVGLAVHEGHMNAGNRVMGAVYYTMADFAFAEYLTAEARAVCKGRRTSFYAAEITDELGTLIATVSSNGFRMDA